LLELLLFGLCHTDTTRIAAAAAAAAVSPSSTASLSLPTSTRGTSTWVLQGSGVWAYFPEIKVSCCSGFDSTQDFVGLLLTKAKKRSDNVRTRHKKIVCDSPPRHLRVGAIADGFSYDFIDFTHFEGALTDCSPNVSCLFVRSCSQKTSGISHQRNSIRA
jgi:hypothetical protein